VLDPISTSDTGRMRCIAAQDDDAGDGTQPTSRRGRVLAIDDEPMIIRVLTRAIGREHDVEGMTDPRAALARLIAGEQFDVVLCDMTMPHMTGLELWRVLREHAPAMADRIVFVTGGATGDGAHELLRALPGRRLQKPFDSATLLARIRAMVTRP
jgi:CheY-like chemotaxis protein